MNYCPDCGTEISDGDRFCSHCGENLDRYGDEPIEAPDQSPGRSEQPTEPTRDETTEEGWSRRQTAEYAMYSVILAAGGGLGGALYLQSRQDGPEAVAKDFIQALSEGRMADANKLVHPDARIDGAGVAGDLILDYLGIDGLIFSVSPSVTNTETQRKQGDDALVAVQLEAEVLGEYGSTEQKQATIGVGLRKYEGDWRVLQLRV